MAVAVVDSRARVRVWVWERRANREFACSRFWLLPAALQVWLTLRSLPRVTKAGWAFLRVRRPGTGTYAQYGERKMLGVTGFVDADGRRRLGIEAEGRWVEFHQSNDVHVETYSIGVRYHFGKSRFQPYVKGLVGFGDFNFPYNLATGRFLVVTGGGTDIRLSRRIYIRAVDFEYQTWPQFTFGAMTTLNGSAGLRVRVF